MMGWKPPTAIKTAGVNRVPDYAIEAINLSPGNAFTVARYPVDFNSADIEQILAYLNGLVTAYTASPFIRQQTVSLFGADLRNNDQGVMARTILQFVRNKMKYVPDPIDGEWIVSPVTLLSQISMDGYAFGDCDDHCLLFASMLGTVGIPARIIGTRLEATDWYDHVITRVFLGRSPVDVDPCYKDGGTPPTYLHTIG